MVPFQQFAPPELLAKVRNAVRTEPSAVPFELANSSFKREATTDQSNGQVRPVALTLNS